MAIGKSRLHEMLRRARRISDLDAWLSAFADERFKERILDWVRYDQLAGKKTNADGDVIGLYSEYTEMMDSTKQAGTPYTLHDTGEFYRSMFILVLPDAVVIDADAQKGNDNLFSLYTSRIIGLDSQNMVKFTETVKNKYIEYIRKILYGT